VRNKLRPLSLLLAAVFLTAGWRFTPQSPAGSSAGSKPAMTCCRGETRGSCCCGVAGGCGMCAGESAVHPQASADSLSGPALARCPGPAEKRMVLAQALEGILPGFLHLTGPAVSTQIHPPVRAGAPASRRPSPELPPPRKLS